MTDPYDPAVPEPYSGRSPSLREKVHELWSNGGFDKYMGFEAFLQSIIAQREKQREESRRSADEAVAAMNKYYASAEIRAQSNLERIKREAQGRLFDDFIKLIKDRITEYDAMPEIGKQTPQGQSIAALRDSIVKGDAASKEVVSKAFETYRMHRSMLRPESAFLPLPVIPAVTPPDDDAVNLSGTLRQLSVQMDTPVLRDSKGFFTQNVKVFKLAIVIDTDDEAAVQALLNRMNTHGSKNIDLIMWPT